MQLPLNNGWKLTSTKRRFAPSNVLKTFLFISTVFLNQYSPIFAQSANQTTISYPLYICSANNPNDYRLFANGGGWDGFWYVGYNRVWIKRFFIPENLTNYKKAFIGAKLGRMKSQQVYKNGKATLDKEAIPGDIYMAISSTISWQKSNWKLLTPTSNIPFEGDSELAIEQTGESQWFWAEIPIAEINFGKDNYIALWSTSSYLNNSTNSPIIAAAWGDKETSSFINDEIRGIPPQSFSTTTLKSALTVFEPAISIKLVPELSQNITIGLMGITEGEKISAKKVVYASILGNEIGKTWLEISKDNKTWEKHGLIIYTAPYIFSINPKKISFDNNETIKKKNESETSNKLYVRICASDIWENTAKSTPLEIFIVDKTVKK
ncbi:MAG: hypothetical protein A2539_02065 [Elusimicrobia bacterium RIFOXYD2_FULL_34_15]|nr:MAG: hypothetical protein A2539_02065 [Elusimicrobia bacterium RIFOXYD2_FULL_34_15]